MCTAGWSLPAWDLTAGYIAGRLVATDQGAHIYDQAGHDTISDPRSAWGRAAVSGGITDGIVTPYIQTPLYAWLVSPFAGRADFATFRHVFLILAASATACLVFVTAWHWAGPLTRPLWQAGLLAGLFFSVPNEVAVALGQTHVYFLLLAVLAIVVEQRGRPVLAGALLALAACVKISPGWIAFAWLAAGNWRAVASFGGFSAGLLGLAWLVAGWAGLHAFALVLAHTGGAEPLRFNNDSLAAVLMGARLNETTAFLAPKSVVMPLWVKLVSAAALIAACAGAGLLDRARLKRAPGQRVQTGALMALIAATAFTPLAWNHYYILLISPVILFVAAARQGRRWIWVGLTVAVVALDLPPLAYAVGDTLWAVALRSEFWAALLCLCALPFLPQFAAEPRAGRAR